jgi:CheY-specific phosphatase CheX
MQAALAASLESVLESMFFIDTSRGTASGEPAGEPPLSARLDFQGDPCGWLALKVSPAAARSIAADFLAEDEPSLSPGQVQDVVCELTNMICGAALSRLESETSFRLEAPEMLVDCSMIDVPGTAVRSVDLGNGVLTALLHFKATPCPLPSEPAS